ncbi:MAG: ribosome biogenesis GTPase Der [Proteobacteria bacterium]|nr:ribosome biogenesis GTPase Der [Pseudomonadota bacterium]
MLPTIAIVGRPNVGKSTLFNRMTKTRAALVHDLPGLTRDRHYGRGRQGEREFIVIDTGGFEPVAKTGIEKEMARQAEAAIAEADAVVFIVDGRDGLAPQDRVIADTLRRSGRPVIVAVNKAEGLARERVTAEFHELALGEPVPISAAHGENCRELVDEALAMAGATHDDVQDDDDEAAGIKVAIVGRPNVGKSTLVNTLLGEERVIAFDQPGTTRDSIALPFERDGRRYTLIDTAGVRKRGKVVETIEKFSVLKTLQAIEDCNVAILLLDATADVSEQDAHIASYILEAGRAVVVGVNKWDAATPDQRDTAKRDISRKLAFLDFADIREISAREGKGVKMLMKSVDAAYAAAMAKLPTPKLTRALQAAIERQQPARAGMVRPKMRYAHQGGHNPPVVVIHGTSLDAVSDAYRRYLEHFFAATFKLRGTPLRIQFKTGANPYAGSASRR